jgi:8-oxo-dGTP pyrophosphatase MutT (NUDIX family)
VREQAGCLPVRGRRPSLEILLVTSRYTGEWIAPKGTIEDGESPELTALREAEEEAGVRGRIVRYLGRFHYPRGGQPAAVEAYELEVLEELEHWPECLQRRRRWFSLAEALREVRRTEVLAMLGALAAAPT